MSVRMKYQGLKLALGGILILGAAVSQALFGWVGEGPFYRYLYPLLLLGVAAFFFLAGYRAWKFCDHEIQNAENRENE